MQYAKAAKPTADNDRQQCPFSLTDISQDVFKIGGIAVDVILSGRDLDADGLEAVIHSLDEDAPVAGDALTIVQPAPDDIRNGSFPITVKLNQASAGLRRIGVKNSCCLFYLKKVVRFEF